MDEGVNLQTRYQLYSFGSDIEGSIKQHALKQHWYILFYIMKPSIKKNPTNEMGYDTLHTESPDYLLCLSSLYITGRAISAEGIRDMSEKL